MSISPSRIAAFDILRRIETERAFSSLLLSSAESSLSPADRALCHELVLGTLRRQLLLDKQIDFFSSGKKLDPGVRIALRLGLYQLRYLDKVPAHAAINDSVNLTSRAGKTSAKGLVNAVLRRSIREAAQIIYKDDVEKVSVETSHPRWLIEKWMRVLGEAETAAIAAANNELPAISYRVLGGPDAETRGLIEDSRRSEFVEDCLIAPRGDARLFTAGNIYIQDEASQMAASAVEVPPHGLFLDVCASPGGKTGLVSLRHPTAKIHAGDLYWPRVEFLRENCERQGISGGGIVRHNAERPLPFHDGAFDSILVDAPCSGTGTIRHNPEIRYHLEPSDIETLPRKQLSILTNASKLLKKGGMLTFSTCSIEREENEDVCKSFLSDSDQFSAAEPKVPARFITAEGFARTWPHRDGMDGFFIAAFQRRR